MSMKNRIERLEQTTEPQGPPVIRVYFTDENGLSLSPRTGPYYPTPEALAAAQGWPQGGRVTMINVVYRDGPRTDIDYPSGKSVSVGVDFDRF
jgi:hypothetical protein